MKKSLYSIGDSVRVHTARDPFNRKLGTVVEVYPDGGLSLKFDGSSKHAKVLRGAVKL